MDSSRGLSLTGFSCRGSGLLTLTTAKNPDGFFSWLIPDGIRQREEPDDL
jgi:hypothetical protein